MLHFAHSKRKKKNTQPVGCIERFPCILAVQPAQQSVKTKEIKAVVDGQNRDVLLLLFSFNYSAYTSKSNYD